MKILKTFLALIATLLCSTSLFAEDFEVDGIYYNITSEAESTVEVTYKGNSFSSFEEYTGSIIIPSFVKHYGITYKVTRIGENAFLACRNLTSISIPNSVISIGDGAFGSTPWYDNQPLGLVYAGKVLYKYKGYISTDTNIVIKEGTLGIADHAFYDCKELTAIALPSTLRNIGESAFMGCKGLKSIVVPEYVTSIGDFAFAGCSVLEDCLINSESITKIGMSVFSFCTSLKSMSIPNSVTSIGMEAFSGCSELINITIGDNVNYIYNNAFRNCRSLISVTIPKRVSTISHETFSGCSSLTSIIIPNSIKQIEHDAFYGCKGLISITIGENVTSIGMGAFEGCDNIQTVTSLATSAPKLDVGNFSSISYSAKLYYPVGSDYSSWDVFRTKQECYADKGVLYSILSETDYTAQVIGSYNLTEVDIVENVDIGDQSYRVTNIIPNAFIDGITSIKIPKTVITIDPLSLRLCNTLKSIMVDEQNIKYDSRDNCVAIIETETNTIVAGCRNSKIPSGVTNIGHKAFYGCFGLTSIEIPNSVTEIGSGAFEGCSSLTSLTIPNSVKSIYCCTFNGCTGLKELIIEDSNEPLESLLDCKFHARHFDDYYFENSPIEHMYIGRDLNNYTFSYTKGDWRETLRTVEFGSKVTNVPNSMFDSCYKLSSVTIPESVTHIGNFAFYYCDSITNIVLPNSLRYIGANSFQGCNLKSITIPKSVTFIGRNAFNETMELEHIIVEGGNTMYDSRFNCNAIIESSTNTLKRGCMNTIIPYNVTKIDSCAFYACTELKNIEIPHSVVDIGVSAFSVCKGLETLVVPNSVVSIEDYAFKNCISLTSATIGDNVKDIGNYAFYSCEELEHIYCTALTPPTIGLNTFDKKDSKYPYTTFYVPRVSLDAYKSADVWKDLENYIFKPMVYMHLVSLEIDGTVIKSDSLEYGTDIILPEIEEKEGYTFVWDNIADKVPNHDFVIQGKYVPNNYAITYVVDGDTIATDSTAYGSAITLLEEPTKEGHTFLGWSEAPETMPAGNITISGEWSINSYLVTYIIDGEVYATDSVVYGATITLPEVPEKENSTFEWEEAPTTMPASDVTIYGNYVSGIEDIFADGKADVYTLSGMLYKRDVNLSKLNIELPKGIYIINGKKFIVR